MSSNYTLRTLAAQPVDIQPLQHLFSHSELDHDLKYVDKTYYASSEEPNHTEKASSKLLSSNYEPFLYAKTMNLLSTLSRLDLRHVGLTVVPNQITLLKKLVSLDISHNRLNELPEAIDGLKSLKHLNASNNDLTSLPNSLYTLNKLTLLDISRNQFTSISPNIAKLTKLELLDISYTDISYLPAELLGLTDTIIKTDHCQKMNVNSIEIQSSLTHQPLSLVETCARLLIKPILYENMKTKTSIITKLFKRKKTQPDTHQQLQKLPRHLADYLCKPKACSSCGGPYFDTHVKRYRIVQRQDDNWVPVEYTLCSAHWNTEKDRILYLYTFGVKKVL